MSDGDIEIRFNLHPAQMQVFEDKTRFRVLAAGRRFGKSHGAIAEASCAALDPANRLKQPVFLIAPTQPQAKILYWRPLLDKLHKLVAATNVNEGLITLNNGVLIGVKGADNPDALRGVGLYFVVMDEFGNMKYHTWSEIIRPALADSRGRALFIGTPPPERNHFYDLYMNAMEGNDPEWKAWCFESKENPFLPAGEIDAARRSMSTSAFNREFRASFDTAAGGSFKQEWFKYTNEEPKTGAFLMTVDLAGFAGIEKATTARQKLLDEHVIAVAKVYPDKTGGTDWWVRDIIKGRWGVMETAKRIVDTLEKTQPTAWGMERGSLYNAVLPQIQDEARKRSINLMSPVPLTHENRIKTERIIWALQGRMEHGKITWRQAPWNRDTEDQFLQFPSKMVHDDIPDAVSYFEQLSQGRVFEDFSHIENEPYWAPQDAAIGY